MFTVEKNQLPAFIVIALLFAGCATREAGRPERSTAPGAGARVGLAPLEFYVATDGNDNNPGTEDAPFATLAYAQSVVQEEIARGLDSGLWVFIRGGRYELTEPWLFGPKDSGSARYAVVYSAYPGETVEISGGRRIGGWKEESNGLWSVVLPEDVTGKTYFRQLFMNGRRAVRARFPNLSAETPYATVQQSDMSKDLRNWRVRLSPTPSAEVLNPEDVELCVLGVWEITRKQVSAIRPEDGSLVLKPPHLVGHPQLHPRPGMKAYLENSPSFLDEPGEWYLDRKTRVLTYWPLPGENISTVEAVAPRLETLVRVEGTGRRLVENLHFVGLRFRHAEWPLPEQGYLGVFACVYQTRLLQYNARSTQRVPSALVMKRAHNCSVTLCEISAVGGGGVALSDRVFCNRLEGNRINDIGANGISVGRGWGEQTPGNISRNSFTDNEISRCGQVFHGGVGISIALTRDTLVARNRVHDLPYSGICVGWSWHTGLMDSGGHRIENNHVFDAVKLLHDAGGLYTLGAQPGTILRSNLVQDIRNDVGIFFDEGSSKFRVEDNYIFNANGNIRFNNTHAGNLTFGWNYYGELAFGRGIIGDYALVSPGMRSWDIQHASVYDPPRFTLAVWINPDADVGESSPRAWVVSKNGDELRDGHFSLQVGAGGAEACMNIGGGAENVYRAVSSAGTIPSQEWTHLAMTYDGQVMRLYCNGSLAGSTAVQRRRQPGSDVLRVGEPPFVGRLDDIRIYRRALTAAELDTLASAPKSVGGETKGSAESDSARRITAEKELVLHVEADALRDRIEAIRSGAGPEERFRAVFDAGRDNATAIVEGLFTGRESIGRHETPCGKRSGAVVVFKRVLGFVPWLLFSGFEPVEREPGRWAVQ